MVDEAIHAKYRAGRVLRADVGAEVEIDAPAERVWSILTDFDRYPEWNPFTVSVETRLRPGDPVVMDVRLPGKRPSIRTEWVNRVEPGRRFWWGMNMLHRSLLTANRLQEVVPLDAGRCRYRTVDEMSGWLTPIVTRFYGESMRRGFESVAHALKARAEKPAAGLED